MRGAFGAGLILITRDGVALGSLERRGTYRGPVAPGHAVQDRFFKQFPLETGPAEVVVEPVVLRDRVVCLYYAHGLGGGPLADAAVADLVALARAAEAAFVRFIQAIKRQSAPG